MNFVSVKAGWYTMMGYMSDYSEFKLPYFAVVYRRPFLWHRSQDPDSMKYEFELGFLSFENSGKGLVTQAFPASFSVLWEMSATKNIHFYPKVGLGGLSYVTSDNALADKLYSTSIFLKPALEMRFRLGSMVYLYADAAFITAHPTGGSGFMKDMDYFFIPSLSG